MSLRLVPTVILQRLYDSCGRLRFPLQTADITHAVGSSHVPDLHASFAGHPRSHVEAVLEATLEERKHSTIRGPELVWNGPEQINATARDGGVVLRELFTQSKERVVLSGYAIGKRSGHRSVLSPLQEAMRERNVAVHFFMHIDATTPDAASAGDRVRSILKNSDWDLSGPLPHVYIDARVFRGERFNMHAKTVVVDRKTSLVTSANLTSAAHLDHLNIECGVLLHDEAFARQLDQQWMALVDQRSMLEVKL